MPLIPIQFEPGFYTEQTASGATNRWKDGDHVRFRYGLPEKIKGWASIPGWFKGVTRRLHDWVSLDTENWLAIGTSKKLYLYFEGDYYDITPIRDGSLPPFTQTPLTNPFDTTASSVTVTVNHPGHQVVAGDFVHFSNASAVGGITIDGEYEVQSAPDFETYTIEHSFAATSTASGGGTVDWMYEISTQNPQWYGWGGGVWGGGVWGGVQASGLPQRIRLWSLVNWGEDLIASPRDGAIYWWDRTLGPNNRAVLIENAPRKVARILLSGQDRHLVALGADDPLTISWCSQEDFDTWIATPINTAGDQRLDAGSELITGIRTRGEIVVWADNSVVSMSFDGPPLVFGFTERGESLTIISPNAMAEINGIVYFMANSDFMVYDGLLRVLPCDVRDHVFGRLNTEQQEKVYCSINRTNNEVWWFFPTGDEEEPNEYVIFNYLENCWYYGTLERSAFHDISPIFDTPYGASPDGKLWKHEIGVDSGTYESLQPFTIETPVTGSWISVAWGSFASKFVAVSFDPADANQVMTSADGETWTAQNASHGRDWRAVCAAEDLSLFIAVATPASGSGDLVMTSPDGVTWTTRTEGISANWRDVIWVPELSLAVAVGSGAGSNDRVMTSPDGITWTARTAPANNGWFGVAWSPELNLLVAVALAGGTNQVMTSPDGINWTLRSSPEANQWNSVAWSPKLGMFAAVSTTGTNRVMTSSDGINWTARAAASANEWRSIIWVDALGMFVAVARDGGTNRVMYSDDGVTWTGFASANESAEWSWLAYSQELQKIVVVSWSASLGGGVMMSDLNQPMASDIESYDAQIGEGDNFMSVNRMIPDFLTLVGSIDATFSAKSYPSDANYFTKGPYTITSATRHVDFRIRGRQISLKLATDAIGDDWRFGTFRVEGTPYGRRGGRARS